MADSGTAFSIVPLLLVLGIFFFKDEVRADFDRIINAHINKLIKKLEGLKP